MKKVLQSYDYTFECAEGLDELTIKKDKNVEELRAAELRLKELEGSSGIDDYKKKFEENRKIIKGKYE